MKALLWLPLYLFYVSLCVSLFALICLLVPVMAAYDAVTAALGFDKPTIKFK